MALFKVYYGGKEALDNVPIKDGYGYVVIDEEAGIGTWYIDVNPDDDETGRRYEISAAELTDEEGNFYTLDDLVLRNALITDFVEDIYNTSSSSSKLDATTQQQIRTAINAPSKAESTPKIYNMTLLSSGWITDGDFKKQSVNITDDQNQQVSLKGYVPPLIQWNGTTGSQQLFDAITKAEVNDSNNAITYYIPIAYQSLITTNLGVKIIDYR